MGRKRTLNYRELRSYDDEGGEERKKDEDEGEDEEEEDEDEEGAEAEAEDEEGAEAEAEDEEEEDEDGEPIVKPKKKKAPAKPKAAKVAKVAKVAKPKRTRTAKVIRLRVVWGVFNNSNQRVAVFDYPRKQEADDHAAKLAVDKKQTYFVQPIKEPMEEK